MSNYIDVKSVKENIDFINLAITLKSVDSKNTNQKCTFENILFKMLYSGLI